MVEIPDSLQSVFTGTLDEEDERFVVEVPPSEIEYAAATPGATYRVAIFDAPREPNSTDRPEESASQGRDAQRQQPAPPVEEGEMREVTIETIGDQGDGIAKVERGFVVIVPGANPGDEPIIEIEDVRSNVAFASVVDSDPRTL